MPAAVVAERLTKTFSAGTWRRRRRALDELSLEVQVGEVFGLLGPNGAGKSTTLKLFVSLIRPTSGRAEVFGLPPGTLAARQRLGYLPENPVFYDHLTAEELLTYFAGMCGYRGRDRRQRASAALDRAGVLADRRRPLRQFSKGMVQRVGLAQALVNEAELIILDEPMSGLDPVGRREVRELILQLRDEGRTLLFSSHILSDAEMLCSRVGILHRGRLVAAGAVSDLTRAAGRLRGWELVVAGVSDAALTQCAARFRRTTRIADGRFSFELAVDARPESVIHDLAQLGAELVSVVPLKATLEDVFISALQDAGPARGES